VKDNRHKWSPKAAGRGDSRHRDDRSYRHAGGSTHAAETRRPQEAAKRRSPSSRGQKKKPSASASGSSSGSGSGSDSDRDEIVHFDWKPGHMLNRRYELQCLLGDGTFGRCCLAKDTQNGEQVAIKIIRDVKRYMENAKIEADILKDIRKADPKGTSGCALMSETFTHEQKYYCLVFEPLGMSLYDFVKQNLFRGFWMQDLQSFSKQCMEALKFLHESLKLTHTDLKPENILLTSMQPAQPAAFPREEDWNRRRRASSSAWESGAAPYLRPVNSLIKLIDFGNATYEDEHHSSIINTRQYRGPEVLLASGWDEKSDLWSIGCILMELYSGEQLFETHEELEHLALMEKIIDRLPQEMLGRASTSVRDRYLARDRNGAWRIPWPDKASSTNSERHVASQRKLVDQVLPHHRGFVDFVGKLLRLESSKRPSAARALHTSFFEERFDD